MKPAPEELIRQLAEIEEDDASRLSEPSIDAMLETYRTGTMDEATAEAFERQLAQSPAHRERLSAAASVELSRPSESVRQAALAAAPRPRAVVVDASVASSRQPRPSERSRRARWMPWLAAAAAAAVLTIGLRPFWSGRVGGADSLPNYEATISGLAEVRSGTEAVVSVATAYPTTTVEISAAPLDESRSGIDIGLYRRQGDRVVRIDGEQGVSIESSRGAVVFRSSADALTASTEAGTWDLYVVAARSGDLPTSLAAASGQSPFEALSASGRRRVEALQLIVRPSP